MTGEIHDKLIALLAGVDELKSAPFGANRSI
jgi:hypothetical protein